MENISLVTWTDMLLTDETNALERKAMVDSINIHEMGACIILCSLWIDFADLFAYMGGIFTLYDVPLQHTPTLATFSLSATSSTRGSKSRGLHISKLVSIHCACLME